MSRKTSSERWGDRRSGEVLRQIVGNSEILIANCKQLPIKQLSPSAQQPFIDLVDKILADKKTGKDSEDEIDGLVYGLSGLTNAEIAVVEGRQKNVGEVQNLPNVKGIPGVSQIINQQFTVLFNGYAQAINKAYNRTGRLFE